MLAPPHWHSTVRRADDSHRPNYVYVDSFDQTTMLGAVSPFLDYISNYIPCRDGPFAWGILFTAHKTFESITDFPSRLDKNSHPHQVLNATNGPGTRGILPPATPYYRPTSKRGNTLPVEATRPKHEPKSPVMSGYGVKYC